jgi:hypothetical protein
LDHRLIAHSKMQGRRRQSNFQDMKRCVIKQNQRALLRHFRETWTIFTIVTTTSAIYAFVRNRHIGQHRNRHHDERHRDGKKIQQWMTTTHVLQKKHCQTKILFREKTSFSAKFGML